MKLNSLRNLFVHELQDLHSAESQLVEALPKMAEAASSSELKQAFSHHLEQTRQHVTRLENILDQLGEKANGETCEGMKGLIKEGEKVINETGDSSVKDAALIAAAQRVEHYEIAAYGAARTYAEQLKQEDAKDLLQATLNEEGDADRKLTRIAEGGPTSRGINEQAQ